jgi:hypothetical protein
MNSMGRDLRPGEIVMIGAEYTDRQDRRFRCERGSGMQRHTLGRALFGSWVIDPDEPIVITYRVMNDGVQVGTRTEVDTSTTRLEGYMISRQETRKLRRATRSKH